MTRSAHRAWLALGVVFGMVMGGASRGEEPRSAAEDTSSAATAVPAAAAAASSAADRQVEVSPYTAEQIAKMTCKTVKVTGSNVRTRRVCTTPDQVAGASDWVRQRQDRGAIEASRALNGGS